MATRLVEALRDAANALYNSFEPDNQSRAYMRARAMLAKVQQS
jgi:hypothetical protein